MKFIAIEEFTIRKIFLAPKVVLLDPDGPKYPLIPKSSVFEFTDDFCDITFENSISVKKEIPININLYKNFGADIILETGMIKSLKEFNEEEDKPLGIYYDGLILKPDPKSLVGTLLNKEREIDYLKKIAFKVNLSSMIVFNRLLIYELSTYKICPPTK